MPKLRSYYFNWKLCIKNSQYKCNYNGNNEHLFAKSLQHCIIAYLKLPTWGSCASFVSTWTIAMDIRAPWRTKSTTSDVNGSSSKMASMLCLHKRSQIPTAKAAPYLTFGLYDSDNKATICGVSKICRRSQMPTAKVTPHLTFGLYDSDNKETICGVCKDL